MNRPSVVVAVGIVAMGIAVLAGLHWNRQVIPVSDGVPGTFAMLGVGVAAGILFGAAARLPVTRTALIVGCTLAGGVILDAIIHLVVPPETGGLFPFAAFAIGVLGLLAGLIGGLVGKGIALLLARADTGGGT